LYSIKRTSPLLRYGVAVVVVGMAVGIKLLLNPVVPQDVPFLLLFGAVMVSAWYGGLGPGLLTVVLAGLATDYFFLRPQDPFGPEAVPLLVFLLEGTLLCLLTEALRNARWRAEASNAEAEREHERLRRSEEHFRSLMEEKGEAEERLKESEGLYRNVVEQVAENIFLIDPITGRIIQANASLLHSLGYEAGELRRLSLYDIVAHDRESVDLNIGRVTEEGQLFIGERQYLRKDGSLIDVEVSAGAIAHGGQPAICVVAHDVTERKKAEEVLKRSLDVQLALYETGRILGSSLEWEEIGSRLLEVVRRVSNLTAAVISVPDEDGGLSIWHSSGLEGLWRQARFAPEALSARQQVLETRERRLLRLQHPEDPEWRYLVGLYLPLLVQDRLIGVLEAYGPDALVDEEAETLYSLASQAASALENARLYTELSERENQLRDLVGKLIVAQEEERRRVAYDVHDGLAQTAAAAHQHLQAYARHHPPCSAELREELDEALELVRELVGEARQVIYDLRPPVLDDFGLAAAVRLQVASLRADGLQIDLEESLGDGRLPQEVETTLFRVAQEALTNIRKHAEASKVRIVLDRPGNAVRLLVEDEGHGFIPTRTTKTNGRGEKVGLSGMRERVSLLGGRFELHSEPGRGTTIEAKVELPETEKDHEE
jgi:PAS domain S-box-containing protein